MFLGPFSSEWYTEGTDFSQKDTDIFSVFFCVFRALCVPYLPVYLIYFIYLPPYSAASTIAFAAS